MNCAGSNLSKIVPITNVADISFTAGNGSSNLIEQIYAPGSKFIGCFIDDDESPDWARKAARILEGDFLYDSPGRKKHFSDIYSSLTADADGKCFANFRYALDAWLKKQNGTPPFFKSQLRGSCVDASCAEGEDILFGFRSVNPDLNEVWIHSSGWYKYAERGYCSDGWNGSGIARVARIVGSAFCILYDLPGIKADFRDEDANELIVARDWCRGGIPNELKKYTSQNHGYEDGAITRFDRDYTTTQALDAMKKAFAEGAFLHTYGRRTSGANKPFVWGPVGPHMQSAKGCDDSDDFRKFCKDSWGITPRNNDYPVHMGQTWGEWSKALSPEYHPYGTDSTGRVWTQADVNRARENGEFTSELEAELKSGWGWGEQPQGLWVVWASELIRQLTVDYVWMPWVKGFPGEEPEPSPDPSNLAGELTIGFNSSGNPVLRGILTDSEGKSFVPTPKPGVDKTIIFVPYIPWT